jgi:hypothetical protein
MGVVCKAITGNVDSAIELKLSAEKKEPGFNCPPRQGRVFTSNRRETKMEHGLKRMGLPQ